MAQNRLRDPEKARLVAANVYVIPDLPTPVASEEMLSTESVHAAQVCVLLESG